MRILLLLLFACSPPTASVARSLALEDSRLAFQAELDAGILDLRGRAGRFEVSIVPTGNPFASLRMPDGAEIIGDGASVTTIAFVGDPAGRDWCGIRPGSHWRISGVTLEVAAPSGTWDEQSHLICVHGPLVDGELHHVVLDHPVQPASSRGDCIQFVGYPALADALDQRIWNQHVHHNTFRRCARSGVAVHSGLHGHMLPPDVNGEIHSSTRFDHNTFLDVADQDLDEEGSGDVGGIDETDVVEWDHNEHHVGPGVVTPLAISIYPGSTHVHHNTLDRGLDILGGSHEIDHNSITQTVRSADPVVYVRKAGSSSFRDDTWVRPAAAGPGPVFAGEQKITAPTNIRLESISMWQRTASMSIRASGIAGLDLRSIHLVDSGPAGVRDAIRVEGSNGPTGIRATGIVVRDTSLTGAFRAAISVSGAYTGGAGTIVVRDSAAGGALQGLRCEGVVPGPTPNGGPISGGISGPVLVEDNAMPRSTCVIPPTP